MDDQSKIHHLSLLKLGNNRSFRYIFDYYHQHVYSFAFKITKSKVLSEEITSDVFIKLWEKRETLDSNYDIIQLLYKITRDYAINYIRKEVKIRLHQENLRSNTEPAEINQLHDEVIFQEYLDRTDDVIEQMPAKQKEIFLLKYKGGMDDKAISDKMQISESTVRVHISNATKFIRTYFEQHPEILRSSFWIFPILHQL